MTEVRVEIPVPLREFTGGAAELQVHAASVRELLAEVQREHPQLHQRIVDPDGQVRPLVNLFVGERDVRSLEGLETPLRDGSVVTILPAVAGGRTASTRSYENHGLERRTKGGGSDA